MMESCNAQTTPEQCGLLAAAAVSPTVQLALWGSQGESSCHTDDLPSRQASSSPEQAPEAAASSCSTLSRASSSSPTPAQAEAQQRHPAAKQQQEQQQHQDWACAVSQAAAAVVTVSSSALPRGQHGGHRSMPGAPDMHPQEVVVKVSVQQRKDAAVTCTKTARSQQGQHRRTKSGAQAQDTTPQQQEQQPQPQKQAEEEDWQQQHQQQKQAEGTTQPQEQPQQEQQQSPYEWCGSATQVQASDSAGSSPRSANSAQTQHTDEQHQHQQQQSQPRSCSSSSSRSSTGVAAARPAAPIRLLVPVLDLSRAQLGKPTTIRAASEPQPLTRQQLDKDTELCLEHSSSRSVTLHPNAPMQDNRCYHYRAVPTKDVLAVQALLDRLQPSDAAQVRDIWDALLTARRDCEAMAARGVRVSRDISRDWQETVSDLIDRVVAQDNELGQLRQQLKEAKQQAAIAAATGAGSHAAALSHTAAAAAAGLLAMGLPGAAVAVAASSPASAPGSAGMEELHTQVIRLKRHRDKLVRELAEARLELQGAQHRAAEVQGQLALTMHQHAQDLREQHRATVLQHMQLAAYADGVEAATAYMQPAQHPGAAAAAVEGVLGVLGHSQVPVMPAALPLQPPSLAAAADVAWVIASSGAQDAAVLPPPVVPGGVNYSLQQAVQLSRTSRMMQQQPQYRSLPGGYAAATTGPVAPAAAPGVLLPEAVHGTRWHLGGRSHHTDGPAGKHGTTAQQAAAAAAAAAAAWSVASAQCSYTMLQVASNSNSSSKLHSYQHSPHAELSEQYNLGDLILAGQCVAPALQSEAAPAAGGGSVSSSTSKRSIASCPGHQHTVLSRQQLLAAQATLGASSSALAAAWSRDIPAHVGPTDLSPRGGGGGLERCHAAGASAASKTGGYALQQARYTDCSGATSTMMGTPHDDSTVDHASATPATSRHFDQQATAAPDMLRT